MTNDKIKDLVLSLIDMLGDEPVNVDEIETRLRSAIEAVRTDSMSRDAGLGERVAALARRMDAVEARVGQQEALARQPAEFRGQVPGANLAGGRAGIEGGA